MALQDDLIKRLGGPDKVAELTGRRKRMLRDPDSGQYHYKLRAQDCPVDQAWPPRTAANSITLHPAPLQHACHVSPALVSIAESADICTIASD